MLYEEKLLEFARRLRDGSREASVPYEPDIPSNDIPFDEERRPELEIFEGHEFAPVTAGSVEKGLGRKKRQALAVLKPLVDILKYRTKDKAVVTISCSAAWLRMIYGSHNNVRKAVQLALRTGLIECVDGVSRFGARPKARRYVWCKAAEKELLELFRSYGTDGRKATHGFLLAGEDDKAAGNFDVRITERTRLPLSDALVVQGLRKRYPQLEELWATIDEDNAGRPLDEADRAVPRISRDRDGNCTSISLRATNQWCSMRKEARRRLILERYGEFREFDVKSSIYRLTRLLNTGEWLPESVDLYELIFGRGFRTEEERDMFKRPLCQYLYFCRSARQARARAGFGRPSLKEWLDEEGDGLVEEARDRMWRAVGRSFGSEIFLHESCVYAAVAHELRRRGLKVIQVYDGFYVKGPLTKTGFDRVVG